MKTLSHVWFFGTPWTVAYQAPLSMGFSRQGYWSGLPFPSPGDLPNPGIELRSPKLQVDSLPSDPLGKLLCSLRIHEYILEHSMYFSPILTLVSWLKRLIALTAFFVSCLAVIEFPSVPSRDSEMKIWEGMKILLCGFHGDLRRRQHWSLLWWGCSQNCRGMSSQRWSREPFSVSAQGPVASPSAL